MDTVKITCDFAYMEIGFVSSLIFDKDFINIHQSLGGSFTFKRESVKRLLYNDKEIINEQVQE